MKPPVWVKIRRKEYGRVEDFLRARESRYVNACSCFLRPKSSGDEIWALPGSFVRGCDESYSALLVYSRKSFYPVFSGLADIPLPSFFNNVFAQIPVHSIQGPAEDASVLEALIKNKSYIPAERIDYDIMTINTKPSSVCLNYGPKELILRPPEKKDVDEIYVLQSAYEKEEVLPYGADFYPSACRTNLERLLKSEKMLLACLGSQIIGKINTSAKSFNNYQIGGVYVLPDFRGLGIAVRMTALFIEGLVNEGRGVSLFVKKSNASARAVYKRVGFAGRGDYRISYF